MAFIYNIPDDDFGELISGCTSWKQVLEYFGLGNDHQLMHIQDRVKTNNITTDHIEPMTYKNDIDIDMIFVENSSIKCQTLKRYIMRYNLIDNKCGICNLDAHWNGRYLTLQLDHINGIANDNRLDNLRFLCPNCHSQTDTYAVNSLTNLRNCPNCKVNIGRNSNMCYNCNSDFHGKCYDCNKDIEKNKRRCDDCDDIYNNDNDVNKCMLCNVEIANRLKICVQCFLDENISHKCEDCDSPISHNKKICGKCTYKRNHNSESDSSNLKTKIKRKCLKKTNDKKCIECGIDVSFYAKRCAQCKKNNTLKKKHEKNENDDVPQDAEEQNIVEQQVENNMKKCIDCDKNISKNATRCRHCYYEYKKIVNANNDESNTCIDCQTTISKQSIRCKPCFYENRKKERPCCIDCGNELLYMTSTRCVKCSSIQNGIKQRLFERPPLDVLQNDVKELGYCGTGRKYGVSDNSIRKWIKAYTK